MNKKKRNERRIGVTWFAKETERAIFFYATVAMFLLYVLSRLLSD